MRIQEATVATANLDPDEDIVYQNMTIHTSTNLTYMTKRDNDDEKFSNIPPKFSKEKRSLPAD